MMIIDATNVNDAFETAIDEMREYRDESKWRNVAPRDGKGTYEYTSPVITSYRNPTQRVLFSAIRDANPFFHFMESLWMLNGRDDAEWLSYFSSQIAQYAEDDGIFWGAYGHRWKNHFGVDQLKALIDLLMREPNTRRAVLSMWDPSADLGGTKRDHPCNTHVYFQSRAGGLNMTVCSRSNDIVLGCYGANVVHFSMLMEYVAAALGAELGTYYHISNSWHFYESTKMWDVISNGAYCDTVDAYSREDPSVRRYPYMKVRPFQLVNTDYQTWADDLVDFMSLQDYNDTTRYDDVFFRHVAVPMRDAWDNYKRGDVSNALTRCGDILASDWSAACKEWLLRRSE